MRRAFTQPIIAEPGQLPAYNGFVSHLLSGIITKSTKMSTLEFADKQLFKPLGIQTLRWGIGLDGYNNGASEVSMKTRDMAKIGYLYLRNGIWDGNEIVTENWIKDSTRKHSDSPISGVKQTYGFQWWGTLDIDHPGFIAVGYGGQYIHVVPDLGLVTVVTSAELTLKPTHQGILDLFVVPSAVK